MTYIVSLPYPSIVDNQKIKWAKEHCSSYQNANVELPYIAGQTTIDFKFDLEEDAVLFALRWIDGKT